MKPKKVKEIISYVVPLQIESLSSKFNSCLEILLSNGKYLLNSEKTNYSFGSLHTIFQKTFNDLKIENLNISNCLLLGLGGGSVIALLRKKHKLSMLITAIEIDPVVIQLGNKYFDLNNYKNLSILNTDAFDYVKRCELTFDLIIVDLYINNEVPGIFHSREFISSLKKISNNNTIILFNKMLDTKSSVNEYNNLVYEMTHAFGTVSFLSYTTNSIENKIICVKPYRSTFNQGLEYSDKILFQVNKKQPGKTQ